MLLEASTEGFHCMRPGDLHQGYGRDENIKQDRKKESLGPLSAVSPPHLWCCITVGASRRLKQPEQCMRALAEPNGHSDV
jgi:hypothetical protein